MRYSTDSHQISLPGFSYRLIFLLLFSAGFETFGQQIETNNLNRINTRFQEIFMENTSTSSFGRDWGAPYKTLLSADLATNFVLFKSAKVGVFFVFTPRIKAFLFDHPTSVRSPSFLPGATLYLRENRDINRPRFFTISYNHHSNGQSGPGLNPDGTINQKGNFATNFATFKYYQGNVYNRPGQSRSQFYNLGIEAHMALLNTGYEIHLKNNYGFFRVNGSWTYNILKKQVEGQEDAEMAQKSNFQRLQVDFSYIIDTYKSYPLDAAHKRLNMAAKYMYRFNFMDNVAVLLSAGYKGQDDYNIYFEDSYSYFKVGLISGSGFSDHFRRK
ncbi:MAG TPA: hypothetical protein VEV16_05055 [Daejeonella sp.]|nr:hypothetical protein [Daejeonella sp.]